MALTPKQLVAASPARFAKTSGSMVMAPFWFSILTMVQLLSKCSARRGIRRRINIIIQRSGKYKGNFHSRAVKQLMHLKSCSFSAQAASRRRNAKNFLPQRGKICAKSVQLEVYIEAFE